MEELDISLLKEIVRDYLDFVSINNEILPFGIRESALPYSKEVVQNAIEKVYEVCGISYEQKKDFELKKYMEILEVGFIFLGHFLPEPEIEFKSKPEKEQMEAFVMYADKLLKRQQYYLNRLKEIKEKIR